MQRSPCPSERLCIKRWSALGILLCLALASSLSMPVDAQSQDSYRVHLPYMSRAITPTPVLPFNPDAIHSGDGTFYAATGAGNCSFDASPADLMVAAMNHTDYFGSLLCGAFIEVTGPKGTIVVRIVDRCPECLPGAVDLSAEAFALIAEPIAGRVRISWRLLSPALSGPIVYRFKEGSSQYWTSVQVRNHRNPIFRVEYLASDGIFREMVRQPYNYFEAARGTGPGSLTLRVTDIFGNQLVDSSVPLVESSLFSGNGQFAMR